MGGTHKQPKKSLSFGALLDQLKETAGQIVDQRDPDKIKYPLVDIYISAFAMFFLQDSSLLEFQRRLEDSVQRNNLRSVFGVEAIPSDSQLRDVIDLHDMTPLLSLFGDYFHHLQRNKKLEEFQVLDNKYLIAIDGSEYFTSEKVHCNKCLVKKTKDGDLRYHHQILQSTLVHPGKQEVIPLAPEFIHNEDGKKKQDCERNAGKRLLKKIKKTHPRLAIIIIGDSLYSNTPFIKELQENSFSFILTAKPNDHKSLYRDVEGLRKGHLLDIHKRTEKGREYIYEWVNDIDLNGNPDSPKVNFLQLKIMKNGKCTLRNAWVTDILITEENVEEITRGGRARWKIENETFNTLKNHGYHLDHNFGHGENHLSEAFFILNLLAFFFHQIFQLTDGMYQEARKRFSARKEYWNCIRSSFRYFLIQSWETILVRITGPPRPFPESGLLELTLD